MKESERKQITQKLEDLVRKKELEPSHFKTLTNLLSTKIGLSFEMIDDDIYKNHIDAGKYVFLEKHNKNFPDQFNSKAKTFGSIIESDNLLALFLLQNTHKNKVDLIYIDPPYNTGGSGFIYNNDYRIKKTDRGLVQVDENDNYRHSKWLSIMKVRLEYARSLLKDTGFIAVSIDDNELYHLKLLLDDVFGAECFYPTLVWRKGVGMWTNKNIRKDHEYILIYEKTPGNSKFLFEKGETSYCWYPLITGGNKGRKKYNHSLWYEIICPKHNKLVWPINTKGGEKCWTISKEKFQKEKEKGNIICQPKINGDCNLKRKIKKENYESFPSLLFNNKDEEGIKEWPFAMQGTLDLQKDLGKGGHIFEYPKPAKLLKNLFKRLLPKNGLVLDFFSGSGTTACATACLNKEDDGGRQFILITNNDGDKKSDTCIFRDILYERLKKTRQKYNLSFKTFLVNNKSLLKVEKDDTFISKQKEYIDTCINLISILSPKLKHQEYNNENNFLVNDEKYGFFGDNLDVNMRFLWKLKKEEETF